MAGADDAAGGAEAAGNRRGDEDRTATSRQTVADVARWFSDQVPDDWFVGNVCAAADRDEIVVTGRLVSPALEGDDDADVAVAEAAAIAGFRERTREQRIRVAERAEAMWQRKVSWVVCCGGTEVPFTTLSVPVMTRLRLDERRVLDTLIGAGAARSRSDALAWCVRLVARHEGEWIERLRDAIAEVDRVRHDGPTG